MSTETQAKLIFSRNNKIFRHFQYRSLWRLVVTLGIYNFWYRTGRRRIFWSMSRLDGDPFEYTGRGSELFVGFMLAVLFLGIYIGIVNLLISFIFINLAADTLLLFAISFSVVPLVYFAQYSARRYLFARSKWRGVRFGVEKGGIGYALRATAAMLVNIATLWTVAPYMMLWLEHFKTSRTWFGNRRFLLHASANRMLPHWILVWLSFFLLILLPAILFASELPEDFFVDTGEDIPDFKPEYTLYTSWFFGGALLYLLIYIRFRVRWSCFIFANMSLGEKIFFRYHLRTRKLIGTYLLGTLFLYLFLLLIFFALLFVIFLVMLVVAPDYSAVASFLPGSDGSLLVYGTIAAESVASWFPGLLLPQQDIPSLAEGIAFGITGVIVAIVYLLGLFIFVLAYDYYIRLAITRLLVESLEVIGLDHLSDIRQRAHDSSVEAGGFADALDTGGFV